MVISHRRRFLAASLVALAALAVLFHFTVPASRDQPSGADGNSGGKTGIPPAAAASASTAATAAPEAPPVEDARTQTRARLAYAQAWDGPLPPALAAFRAWTDRYRAAASPAARRDLEAEGVALARARRPELRRLIISDPQRALAVTVPAAVRQALPAAVLAELETRHAGRGDYALQAMQPGPDPTAEPPLRRIVFLGGTTFTARAYGRRESQLTKEGASLHGIALDGQFALHESPLRMLEPGEDAAEAATAAAPPVCAACALAIESAARDTLERIAFDGRLLTVHDGELGLFEGRALAAEDQPGPRVAPLTSSAEPPRAAEPAVPHTIGTKQVLVIRADFSDFPGEPLSQAAAQTVVDGAVRSFFEDGSYGQTSVTATVSTQTYRLPRSGASYATAGDNTGLHTDARTAAGADFTLGNYDRVIVVFPNLGTARVSGSRITYGGLANVSGTNAWINGPASFALGTVSHELGHTYGLLHGNLWRVNDGNPVSIRGNTLEYGDPFDMMGSASVTAVTRDARHHFNMWAKNRLGWLPDGAVTTATTSGTYRIHRFDHRAAPRDRPLALRVFRDGVRWFWVGLRQSFATGTPRSDGAYVVWGYNQRLQSQLLDLTTPGSSANDAYLPIGTAFTDAASGVTLKPVARGGSDPEQWLEIEVTVPATPPNVVTAWGREGASFFDTETGENVVPTPETNVPQELSGIIALAAGDQHALALKADGTVVAWGAQAAGQIAVPSGLSNVVALAAGGHVSGAVRSDGTVVLWGDTTSGILTPPEGLRDVVQLAIGGSNSAHIYHALALKSDGTVVGWGDNTRAQAAPPANLGRVTAIAASDRLSVALRADGTVVRWGTTFAGAVPFPTGLADVTAIASSGAAAHALALKRDGTVVGWGVNSSDQVTVPAGLNNVTAIATGGSHSLALKADGTVVLFGNTGAGRGNVPRAAPRAVAVAASGAAAFALSGAPVVFVTPLAEQFAVTGGNVTFRAGAVGTAPLTYQWRKDGVPLAGATGATLSLPAVAATAAGRYDVGVTALGTTVYSAAAPLVVDASGAPEVSRIANLSIRTNAGTGANTLIVGFAIGGSGTSGSKPLLIRGVGPTLGAFGVDGTLADPRVELYGGTTKLFENDNWSTNDAPVFASVGAFPLTGGSRDAALYNPALAAGGYSAQVSGAGSATGVVLAEIYDLTAAAGFTAARPRLINVSARTVSGTGANVLIAGFVIAGPAPKRVLIRAIGPTLEVFGVTGFLADPRLTLFDSAANVVRENDNWGGDTALDTAFGSVGAFRLVPGSRDAALVAELPPGSYTAQVAGVGGTTGVALVEIYEVP